MEELQLEIDCYPYCYFKYPKLQEFQNQCISNINSTFVGFAFCLFKIDSTFANSGGSNVGEVHPY